MPLKQNDELSLLDNRTPSDRTAVGEQIAPVHYGKVRTAPDANRANDTRREVSKTTEKENKSRKTRTSLDSPDLGRTKIKTGIPVPANRTHTKITPSTTLTLPKSANLENSAIVRNEPKNCLSVAPLHVRPVSPKSSTTSLNLGSASSLNKPLLSTTSKLTPSSRSAISRSEEIITLADSPTKASPKPVTTTVVISSSSPVRVNQNMPPIDKRTGRYLAVGVCLTMIFITVYNTFRVPMMTGLIPPAIIMLLYLLWIVYFAKKRKRQAQIEVV